MSYNKGLELYKKISLNGSWKLQPSNKKPVEFNQNIVVPSLVDNASPSFNWEESEYFWYQKTFELPTIADDQVAELQLEQVMFGTEVWLNGKKIGGDIPCYTSQYFKLNDFLLSNEKNTLEIRVGKKETLPKHSAVGNDFEKISWIPGIWGDVWIHIYTDCRVKWTQVIPDIDNERITINSEVENFAGQLKEWQFIYELRENDKKHQHVSTWYEMIHCPPNTIYKINSDMSVPDSKLWTVKNPFLYELTVIIRNKEKILYQNQLRFGMRKFEIRDGHFYLNNKRKVLMGSNIAFHRLLSDKQRNRLPWQEEWIKKVLVDIPKEHNMFFFRFHLGHVYNKWYDIADEYGIMLQDEWMFWTTTGTNEQIKNEFNDWIRENCNHPSIVIWDALNESESEYITKNLIPELKKLDPTRPWEKTDFPEDHPYIYSLGPVLNDKQFGFTRSVFDIQNSDKPTMVNEYLWWWLDSEFNASALTEKVVERWLGKVEHTSQLLSDHQCFLAAELTELWRRFNVDAIMPFVYLSTDGGATANWFQGLLEKAEPKPLLKTLKNAFSPIGVSIELWDRHFLQNEIRNISVFIFNDTEMDQQVNLELELENKKKHLLFTGSFKVASGQHKEVFTSCDFSFEPGQYHIMASLLIKNGTEVAISKKVLYIFKPAVVPENKTISKILLIDNEFKKEITQLLQKNHIEFENNLTELDQVRVAVINLNPGQKFYDENREALSKFVNKGGILILQEPEFSITTEESFNILDDLQMKIKYREDKDEGGYDSYVFPDNENHKLWNQLKRNHFQFFNGALGGEIVSQHDVFPNLRYEAFASCHFKLELPAVMEINYGLGKVIISRIQVRGRLLHENSFQELYGRCYDPVAEQYFWNLLTSFVGNESH